MNEDSPPASSAPAEDEAKSPSPPLRSKGWQPPSTVELQALLPQYEITLLLGRGGMGAVYKGTQKNLDRPVAIKILPPDMEDSDGANFAERFKNEARAMAKLNHPGIVGVHDSGETADGLLYIVMEFIEGTDVSRMIAKQGRLHTDHAMAITAHVCDALQYAHERGIIHRDIKPANIMVGYDGVVKVADFGLAKMNQTGESGLTRSGMAMGTLHYMAPEALMLGLSVDHRADVYAVGVMLYQMLTGKLPQGMFDPPSQQVPGLDPRFDKIIAKAIRDDRDSRYQSASAMRADLDGILTQPVIKVEASADKAPAALPTQARPQRPADQPYRPPPSPVKLRKQRQFDLRYFVANVLLLGGLAYGYWWFNLRPAAEPAAASPAPNAAVANATATLTEPPAGPWLLPFPAAVTHLTRLAPAGGGYIGNAPSTSSHLTAAALVVTSEKTAAASYYYTFSDSIQIEGAFEAEMRLEAPASATAFDLNAPVGSRYLGLHLDLQQNAISWTSSPQLNALPTLTDALPHLLKIRVFRPLSESQETCQVIIHLDDQEVLHWTGTEQELPTLTPSNVLTPRPNLLSFSISLEGGGSFKISSYRLRSLGGTIQLTPKQDITASASNVPLLTPAKIDQLKQRVLQALTAMRLDDTKFSYEISPTGLVSLEIKDPAVSDLGPLRGLPVGRFTINNNIVLSDLSAIAGPELEYLWVSGCKQLTSLAPLANCSRLYHLQMAGCPVTDLTPLKKLPLVRLAFAGTRVTNISPLRGLPLERIYFEDTAVTDVSPLAGCPALEIIGLSKTAANPVTLRQLPKLQYISSTYDFKTQRPSQTAAEFWASLPAPAPKPPAGANWIDTKGRSITATFKAINGDNVLLEIAGKTQPVPMSTLSAASQQQARDLQRQVKPSSLNGNAVSNNLAKATKDAAFINTLGMKFVSVPDTDTLFCMHETRRQDYAAYAAKVPSVDGTWQNQLFQGVPVGRENDHPVVAVSWDDAQKFCTWLSKQEGRVYRLPTDHEWSVAVGIGKEEEWAVNQSPQSLSRGVPDVWPWGKTFPPKPADRAGNYADTVWRIKFPTLPYVERYTDGFATTAPVMSFAPNALGIHDLGGNVFEWCAELHQPGNTSRVMRGHSFAGSGDALLSSQRSSAAPDSRISTQGFRVVLQTTSKAQVNVPAAPLVRPPPLSRSGGGNPPGLPAALQDHSARFTFDDSVPDEGAEIGPGLQHDGVLDLPRGWGGKVKLNCPRLNYDKFTVVVRLRATSDTGTLLAGGAQGNYWLALYRFSPTQLSLSLNHWSSFRKTLEGLNISSTQPVLLAISCDIEKHLVCVSIDQQKEINIELPVDFKFDVLGTAQEQDGKFWHFEGFLGYVDELLLYNRILKKSELRLLQPGGAYINSVK